MHQSYQKNYEVERLNHISSKKKLISDCSQTHDASQNRKVLHFQYQQCSQAVLKSRTNNKQVPSRISEKYFSKKEFQEQYKSPCDSFAKIRENIISQFWFQFKISISSILQRNILLKNVLYSFDKVTENQKSFSFWEDFSNSLSLWKSNIWSFKEIFADLYF